ncbi:MAG: undecaprenyl/decaprenyl-phosphate alpha-N-acetylglucosaminyl 1-phosphate transferase, partial [Defluviitaleaceae bacterium]|nr:undecaprenyl/decaprenyl-phosphate alpha-N-acetylglucosaminyl 1-phosphate transferase [Defluviitaleaceae bacterium]
MWYFLAFAWALAVVLALIPLLSRLAVKLDYLDKPTERKKHTSPVPLVGGAAMFCAFVTGLVIFLGVKDIRHLGILIAGALVLAIGLADDWFKTKNKEFPIFPRFLVQIAAAVIVFLVGVRFGGVNNPFTHQYIEFPFWLQFILTVTWIFGVTTVINWIDGLDGLAGGIAAISGATLFVAAVIKGQPESAYIAALLVGASLGFLRSNIFPAKVFMGDSGANFLGFMLAVISLYGAFKQATVISVFVPVLALGVPIFDSIFVIIKRFWNRQPVYKADRTQIQFRLQRWGLRPPQAMLVLVLASACLGLTSIILLL